jgi:hypothetical protein
VKRELTPQEREDFRRIMGADRPSPVDWEEEARRFEARKALADEMHATGVDPYVRRLREAAESEGREGNPVPQPGRDQDPNEEVA